MNEGSCSAWAMATDAKLRQDGGLGDAMDFQCMGDCGMPLWQTCLYACALFALIFPLVIGVRNRARSEKASLSLTGSAPAARGSSILLSLLPALLLIGAVGLPLSAMGDDLLQGNLAFPDSVSQHSSGLSTPRMLVLICTYAVPTVLLGAFRKSSRVAAWAASIFSLLALVWGCRALDARWSTGLFFALMPLGLLFIHAQARLRDEERASLSIRR